jgi:hypothetical protein
MRQSGIDARTKQVGNWLISTLAWGPLLAWVAWPLLDERLSWHAAVGYSGMVALALNWVYHGRLGVNKGRWPMFVGIAVAFSVSFSVAARSTAIGTFAALSVVVGGLASSIVSALIVVLAVCMVRVPDYGTLEDTILLAAPLIVAAKMAGITAGAIAHNWGSLVLGILAGLGAGTILSVFCLGWVYGAVGIAASWAAKNAVTSDQVWWMGES